MAKLEDISDIATPLEDISDIASPVSNTAAAKPGYFQSIGNAWKTNEQQIAPELRKTAAEDVSKGTMNTLFNPLGSIHAMGTIAGAVGKDIAAPITEIPAVKNLLAYLGQKTNAGTVPAAPYPGMTNTMNMGTPQNNPDAAATIGQMVNQHPTIARLAGDVANIAGLATLPSVANSLAGGAVEKASASVGEGLQDAAARMQGTKVKIGIPEMKQGASNDLYKKYGVFGNADQVQQQWQSQITDKYSQLKDAIASGAQDPANNIDLNKILNDAKTNSFKGKSSLQAVQLNDAIDELTGQLKAAYGEDLPPIDLAEAQQLKQYIGKSGDWLSKSGSMSGNPDAAISGQAHNAIYDAMKTGIEEAEPSGVVKDLNNSLSEMIPMERAASKQVLVSNRKNPISLDDYIGGLASVASAAHGNIGPALLTAANMATKSPTVARGLYNLGDLLKGQSKSIGQMLNK